MAVTNLTNTSWVINDSYSIPSIPSPYASKEFYIDFTIEGDLSFVGIEFNESITYGDITYTDSILYDTGSGTSPFVAVNGGATWQDNSYKTVHISGGTDATNSSLISWFEANATKIFPLEYIDKVVLPSEEEYNIKDTISGYLKGSDLVAGTNISIEETSEGQLEISSTDSGIAARIIKLPIPTITDLTGTTWLINSTPDISMAWASSGAPVSIAFQSDGGNNIVFGINISGTSGITYYSESYQITEVYYSGGGWSKEAYRTVAFTSDVTEETGYATREQFVTWLLANATQVS